MSRMISDKAAAEKTKLRLPEGSDLEAFGSEGRIKDLPQTYELIEDPCG